MHGGQVMDALIVDKALGANLGAPSISHGSENLYMRGPLEEATRENLSKVLYPVDGFTKAEVLPPCFAHGLLQQLYHGLLMTESGALRTGNQVSHGF